MTSSRKRVPDEYCNICPAPIDTPNPFGYCNEHLRELIESNVLDLDSHPDSDPN